MSRFQLSVTGCCAVTICALVSFAEVPDVDQRNVDLRHTDFEYQTLIPNYDEAGWAARREELRDQILSAAGLLPEPVKFDLRPEVFGRLDRDGYSIEKVILETQPGFYLSGNLYRPMGSGPFPAVLSPHGHWSYGRLENSERGSVPARAVHLARQGFVVFAYDMIGYNDTRQLPHQTWGGKREQLWSVGLLGAQLWNSIRALDFLETLPYVDKNSIGATGASGGATQVFLLSAVDERVRFSAPVNMVSGLMQGGSPCENAPNLRIDTNNVEIAALAAPRPMLMVSATGDWTKNLPHNEFPAVQRIYQLLKSGSAVEAVQIDAPHNYNQESREAVYRFFGTHILGQSASGLFAERSWPVEQLGDMLTLWQRTQPPGGITLKTFIDERIGDANEQVEQLRPFDSDSLDRSRKAFRRRLSASLLARTPASEDLVTKPADALEHGEMLYLGRRGKGDRIPAVVLESSEPNQAMPPVLIVHGEGTAWVLSSSESQVGLVGEILFRGGRVLGIDAFQMGRARASTVKPEEGSRAERYMLTFNRTDTARRVQDVLTAVAYARSRFETQKIQLVCPGKTGPVCVLARALLDGPVDLAADWDRFDSNSDQDFAARLFVPGLRRAGDFRAASTLLPGGRVLLWNVGMRGFPQEWAKASFFSAQQSAWLEMRPGITADADLAAWLSPGGTP